MIKNYAKRPENVEAGQYSGTNAQELIDFCPSMVYLVGDVLTFTGIPMGVGDWVKKDVGGVFALVGKDVFPLYYNVPGGPSAE